MARSHDRFTDTSRQLTTSLRTGTAPVVPVRATESCKCQTSITRRSVNTTRCFRTCANILLYAQTSTSTLNSDWRILGVTSSNKHVDDQFSSTGNRFGWLVVFYVPSTAMSFQDGTPIYCPLRRT